jgi:adenosine deaminase
MSVFLILALDRGNTTATQAQEIIDLAIANKQRGVVGVDLCGNPTQGDVTIYRAAFAKAKTHGLGLTLHFAETPASGVRDELAVLLSFRPDRLGHVIHVPDDIKAEIVKRRLGLELCMSCNVHAKLIDGGFLDHHFGSWRNEDCPIALCVSFCLIFLFFDFDIIFGWWSRTNAGFRSSRQMMWASFAALSQMSICLRLSILGLIVLS